MLTKKAMGEITECSKKFYAHLTKREAVFSYSDDWKEIYHLIETAFMQYKLAWLNYDLHKWEWPYNTVDKGEDFEGNQPWSVCLRQAVALNEELQLSSFSKPIDSMYQGITPFNHEQLIFVVESILTSALDVIESYLPTNISWEEHLVYQSSSASAGWERGIVENTGMSLSIFAANLLNDSIGSRDALVAAGNFDDRIEDLLINSWEEEGQSVRDKIAASKGSYNVKDVLPNYPNCRELAELFVNKVFTKYLKNQAGE